MAEWAKLDRLLREKSLKAIEASAREWKEKQPEIKKKRGVEITFLGTGGNPEAVISQVPRTGGFYLQFDDLRMLVDPGLGAPLYARECGIDLRSLDAVYISHGHTDHYAGAETVIEAMCWAMSCRRGMVLGPGQVFAENRVISCYHQGQTEKSGYRGGPEVVVLEAFRPVEIKGARLTPVPVYHGGENYGFILEKEGFKLGYTSDTSYIKAYRNAAGTVEVGRVGTVMDLEEIVDFRRDLKEIFGRVDVLIANVTSHNSWFHRHITTLGLAHLLRGSRVQLCLLTHFNYSCVVPEDLRPLMARYVEEYSGVAARAVRDGETVLLDCFRKLSSQEA
ncbi:MAG: hypothetical protein PWQ91_599 [Eubacteriales bacterium]|nr:hypothetical protein [Eubacteriales bacterium]